MGMGLRRSGGTAPGSPRTGDDHLVGSLTVSRALRSVQPERRHAGRDGGEERARAATSLWGHGATAGPALRPDRARRPDLGGALRSGVLDARGDQRLPGAADPAGPFRRGAQAAPADLRPLRGAGAADLLPHGPAAAEGHREPADGPP